jgi:glycosyltransferase involved in cell wall biosynthesis
MKKIWIMNHYATDMFENKGGRHFWFAKNLMKQGYDPTVFCANTFHQKREEIDLGKDKHKVLYSDEIPFVFIKTKASVSNGMDRIKNMTYFYFNLLKVAKRLIKKGNKPDLILASSVHPLTLVAGIKLGKKFNIPVICEVRDLWPEAIFTFNKAKENSILGKLLVRGEHWIYKRADALIFTKEGDTDYIKEKKWDLQQGGKVDLSKAHYINNGVDVEAFNSSIKNNILDDKDLEEGKFNVVYVGAIRPINNVDNLLDTAVKLKDYNDIQFLIYGDGNQRETLEKRLLAENISNVKFKGFVNKKYIPYILSKSSVNILNYSSNQYNWARGNSSNKLFEYLASGKPVISTIKMGYSIIDKYNCGFELEDNNPDELMKAILNVRNMNEVNYKQYSANAKLAANDFDFKLLTQKLIKVMESII